MYKTRAQSFNIYCSIIILVPALEQTGESENRIIYLQKFRSYFGHRWLELIKIKLQSADLQVDFLLCEPPGRS
jgi:hypothetical protein